MTSGHIELKSDLDGLKNELQSVEFWFARDLKDALGYSNWESFEKVVLKAAENARAVGIAYDDHFRQVTKKVSLGSGAEREIVDYALSRYGAYLVAINADSSKPNVAFVKHYFVEQTTAHEDVARRIHDAERLEGREQLRSSEKILSKLFHDRGLGGPQIASVRAQGDKALFGGESTKALKARFGISASKPLADFLPALTIAAKNLISEMTKLNLEQSGASGESAIASEHVQNSVSVRGMLAARGIAPEDLPPEEDIAKVGRRIASQEKKLSRNILPAAGDLGS